MLELIASKIRINEQLGVIAKQKSNSYYKTNKDLYYYWLGVANAQRKIVADLKEIQVSAEQDVSSIDHCLDALRGL